MKASAPQILRKGAVIRVAGSYGEPPVGAPAYATSFVDLHFDDGHVERWRGTGSLRADPSDPVPYTNLVAWGTAVALEYPMSVDLGMAFSNVDRSALDDAPIEVVIEWNAQLPELA